MVDPIVVNEQGEKLQSGRFQPEQFLKAGDRRCPDQLSAIYPLPVIKSHSAYCILTDLKFTDRCPCYYDPAGIFDTFGKLTGKSTDPPIFRIDKLQCRGWINRLTDQREHVRNPDAGVYYCPVNTGYRPIL